MTDKTALSPRLTGHSHRRSIMLFVFLVVGISLWICFVENNILRRIRGAPVVTPTTSLPKASESYFRRAYDTAYDATIQETSCKTPRATNCFPRKRVNFTTFTLKSQGGLSDADRVFVEKTYYNANSVFEFGVGESTDIAAATNLPRYVGVDSSSEWVKMVRDRTPDRFRFFFADVGKTGMWGLPVEEATNTTARGRNTTSKMILDYQIAPLFLENIPFDVYMVDGRWRVACVMACFLHAMHCGGDMRKIRVILHDYPKRPQYNSVEQVAKVEERVGNAILLSKKPDVTEEDLYDLWKQFMTNTG